MGGLKGGVTTCLWEAKSIERVKLKVVEVLDAGRLADAIAGTQAKQQLIAPAESSGDDASSISALTMRALTGAAVS